MENLGLKLLGTKEEFVGTIKPNYQYVAGDVWDWNIKMLEKGRLYLQWALIAMRDNLGKDTWKETQEELLYYGPDNFQLNYPREKQELVKKIWWKFVKYQYNLAKPLYIEQ
jgi:hypothetical protein